MIIYGNSLITLWMANCDSTYENQSKIFNAKPCIMYKQQLEAQTKITIHRQGRSTWIYTVYIYFPSPSHVFVTLNRRSYWYRPLILININNKVILRWFGVESQKTKYNHTHLCNTTTTQNTTHRISVYSFNLLFLSLPSWCFICKMCSICFCWYTLVQVNVPFIENNYILWKYGHRCEHSVTEFE